MDSIWKSNLIRVFLVFWVAFLPVGCGGGGGGGSHSAASEQSNLYAEISSPVTEEGKITIYPGQQINLQGSVANGTPPYSYMWTIDKKDKFIIEDPGNVTFDAEGNFTVTFTVTDSKKTVASSSILVVVLSKADLSVANQKLADFINSQTDANYDALVDAVGKLGDTQGAALHKAVVELLGVYRSDAIEKVRGDLGLGEIGFDTDFEALKQTIGDPDTFACNFLKTAPYLADAKSVLSETEGRLTKADALLAKAEGLDISFSLNATDTVHFDTIDIKVLRSIANLAKAMILYLQALDFNIENYTVHYNGLPIDIRELVKEKEFDNSQGDMVWEELLANNPNLLTYNDRANKLAAFRNTLEAACNHYSSAVTALDKLGEEGRKARYDNAFNFDNQYDMEMAKAIRDKSIASALACIDGPSASFISIRTEELDEGSFQYTDGFYYPWETHDFYLDSYGFNSSLYGVSAYNLLNPGGTKTLSDLIAEIRAVPKDVDYQPYALSGSSFYLHNIKYIDWSDPETYPW